MHTEPNAPNKNYDEAFINHLLKTNKITRSALERVISNSRLRDARYVYLFSKLGIISENDLVELLSSFYNIPKANTSDFPKEALFLKDINDHFLLHHHILPLSMDDNKLTVAIADPSDEDALAAISFFSSLQTTLHVAALTDIDATINRLYGTRETEVHTTQSSETVTDQTDTDLDVLSDLASEAPIIRIVHTIIDNAIESRASDIHLEPFIDRLRVRFRIDGVLVEQKGLARQTCLPIVSRIKIMAKLNIAERRLPQDGRISHTIRGKDIDIRVSTSPTIHGESTVLRILNKDAIPLSFASLGFDEQLLHQIQTLLSRPNGILLVTGPTGSGKTTTLYTALLNLNTPEKKILTIEDPIEYQLDGINQQEVHSQIQRTFSKALRSFLRQDPDIMMVGEIRDTETAQIAVQSALTGHLILSTLHTNNASSAITRLINMGIETYLLTPTIIGVIGQRLVRKLCKHCRKPDLILPEEANSIFTWLKTDEAVSIYKSAGCPICNNIGYSGRTIIAEILVIDDTIRNQILKGAEERDIHAIAVGNGMRSIQMHGLTKVLSGETSLDEVLRVTREE